LSQWAAHQTLILYWGRQGGGSRFTRACHHSLESSQCAVNFSFRSDLEQVDEILQTNTFANLRITKFGLDYGSMFSILRSIKFLAIEIIETSRFIKENKINRVVSLMLSPWDLLFQLYLRLTKCPVEWWRVVHDVQRHPGELWPPNWLLQLAYKKSQTLIFLNHEVMKSSNVSTPKKICPFFELPKSDQNILSTNLGRVLFIGRIRKYKGLDLLEKSWKLLNLPNTTLRILGQGELPKRFSTFAEVKLGWIEEKALEIEISSAEVVVFPYNEASQSGILEICKNYEKKVVITPLASLQEQVKNYEYKYVSKSFSPKDFAKALSDALDEKVKPRNSFDITKKSSGNEFSRCLEIK
jgi:glycosyltransferase involved in cell wall biosynthesis